MLIPSTALLCCVGTIIDRAPLVFIPKQLQHLLGPLPVLLFREPLAFRVPCLAALGGDRGFVPWQREQLLGRQFVLGPWLHGHQAQQPHPFPPLALKHVLMLSEGFGGSVKLVRVHAEKVIHRQAHHADPVAEELTEGRYFPFFFESPPPLSVRRLSSSLHERMVSTSTESINSSRL